MATNHLPDTNHAHAHESSPLLPTSFSPAHHSSGHEDERGQGDGREHVHVHVHGSEGESGRSGFHPRHFFSVLWNSSCTVSKYVNFLWPVVLVAFFLRGFSSFGTSMNINPLIRFTAAYLAVIPTANLVGFAGQELARKMSKVKGILVEVALGGVVEVVLFVVLVVKHESSSSNKKGEEKKNGNHGDGDGEEGNDLIPIIQAAILGSILTNLLLCLGLVFFFGGLRRTRQTFHAVVSEVGTGLLLVAAFGLLIPSAFYSALKGETSSSSRLPGMGMVMAKHENFTREKLQGDILHISHATSVALIAAFGFYIWFQARSQHSIFDEVIEMDEHRDADRQADLQKPKFTMTETLVALVVSLTLVTLLLIFLVEGIEHVVQAGVPDQFLGLILLPLVEKAAEHLTAIDEAWDGVINVALYHCLAPSIQTALFNGPLVVLVGWALGKPMDLNFEIFMVVLLVISILVVGNFLRDGESNWLEGALLVVVYVIIAIACWYYPNPDVATSNSIDGVDGVDGKALLVNVTMTVDTLKELQRILSEQLKS